MAYTLAKDLAIGPEDIGIGITHGALGSHLGIVYSEEDASGRVLHLGWHKYLLVEAYPPENWLASIMQIPVVASSQAVALVRGMAEKYADNDSDGVDYGINLFAGRNAIQIDGVYKPGPDCDGFTCASIVAEIFEKVGFKLVDLQSWDSNAKNEAWGRAIVCMLRATNTPEDHVTKVEANNRGLRLRPEEVAAAAELPPSSLPASQKAVQERADQIYAQMKASCGPARGPSPSYRHCVVAYETELAKLELVGSQNDPGLEDVKERDEIELPKSGDDQVPPITGNA